MLLEHLLGYHNMGLCFTSIEHTKNKLKNQDIKQLTLESISIQVASLSFLFIPLHVDCLTFKVLFTKILVFSLFQHLRCSSQHHSLLLIIVSPYICLIYKLSDGNWRELLLAFML